MQVVFGGSALKPGTMKTAELLLVVLAILLRLMFALPEAHGLQPFSVIIRVCLTLEILGLFSFLDSTWLIQLSDVASGLVSSLREVLFKHRCH